VQLCNSDFVLTLILWFCRDVDEICALLGCNVASCSDCLPFWDSISVPSSRVKSPAGKKASNLIVDSRRVGAQVRYSVGVMTASSV
jgi:hypothetical protein